MFMKYNAVLRGKESVHKETVAVLAQAFEQLCRGNMYPSTLAVINASICKLSKITRISRVYRAPGGLLPNEFWHETPLGVIGGVEFAFMSATLERDVALQYAARSRARVLFELKPGLADRGADLSWCSQYPEEKEICFPPMCGLFVDNKRVDGAVLVVEISISSHYSDPTISDELATQEKERRAQLDAIDAARSAGLTADARLARAVAEAAQEERDALMARAIDVLRQSARVAVGHSMRAISDAVQAARPFTTTARLGAESSRVELVRSELELAIRWAEHERTFAAATGDAGSAVSARAVSTTASRAVPMFVGAEAAFETSDDDEADPNEPGGHRAQLVFTKERIAAAQRDEARRAAAVAELAAASACVAAREAARYHQHELETIQFRKIGLGMGLGGASSRLVTTAATLQKRMTLDPDYPPPPRPFPNFSSASSRPQTSAATARVYTGQASTTTPRQQQRSSGRAAPRTKGAPKTHSPLPIWLREMPSAPRSPAHLPAI